MIGNKISKTMENKPVTYTIESVHQLTNKLHIEFPFLEFEYSDNKLKVISDETFVSFKLFPVDFPIVINTNIKDFAKLQVDEEKHESHGDSKGNKYYHIRNKLVKLMKESELYVPEEFKHQFRTLE